MKNGIKRVLSFIITFSLILGLCGNITFATEAESPPTSLEAPQIIFYDSGSYYMAVSYTHLTLPTMAVV